MRSPIEDTDGNYPGGTGSGLPPKDVTPKVSFWKKHGVVIVLIVAVAVLAAILS